MLLKLKYFSYILITIPFLIGHAPWGQHQVYRQMHMLIMCSKMDEGAYSFTKELEKTFNIYLPASKARVARAPNTERIINMLRTNQIPLAILSYELIEQLIDQNSEHNEFISKNTKVIFSFSKMILISNLEFSSEKSLKIFEALTQASEKTSKNGLKFLKKNDLNLIYDKKIKEKLKSL